MNILIANWTWYPSGGDWTAIENLIELYQSKGHRVIPFSMKDERNYDTPYSKYFVENIDYKELNKNKSLSNSIKVVKRSIYFNGSKIKLSQLLKDVKIDIAHLHNIGPQITPSICPVLKENKIPILWTLHDYGALCPNTSFVSNGTICERCKADKFYHCTLHKCKKGSYSASAVSSLRSYIYKFINTQQYIDYYICPSRFLKSKFEEYGYDKNRLVHLYNPYNYENILQLDGGKTVEYSNYILYIGRIEKIKGILTLLTAMKHLKDVNLVIIGRGEAETVCHDYVRENNLTNVHLVGHVEKTKVISFIKHSLFTVCPSEWYENFPYSIVEPMVLGKAVVGARIGGIPELVVDGETGFTFNPGDVNDLKSKIELLLSDQNLLNECGKNACEHVSKMVDFETHYQKMEKVFQQLKRN